MKEDTKNGEEEKRTERMEEVWSFSHFFALLLKDLFLHFVISPVFFLILLTYTCLVLKSQKKKENSIVRVSTLCLILRAHRTDVTNEPEE